MNTPFCNIKPPKAPPLLAFSLTYRQALRTRQIADGCGYWQRNGEDLSPCEVGRNGRFNSHKTTYILQSLAKIRVDGELEARLEALEQRGY
jgi:hypothetical protein